MLFPQSMLGRGNSVLRRSALLPLNPLTAEFSRLYYVAELNALLCLDLCLTVKLMVAGTKMM